MSGRIDLGHGGPSETWRHLGYFWSSGLNRRFGLSLVPTNFSMGRKWCISWLDVCVCLMLHWTLSVPKGFRGRNLTSAVWWALWIWEAGVAKLWMLCLNFIAVLCLSVEVLRGYSTKPILSAKRLLGLHNHGTISFPFSFLWAFFVCLFVFLRTLSFPHLFEIVSLHVNWKGVQNIGRK